MITRAAIKQDGCVYIGKNGGRHDSVFAEMKRLGVKPKPECVQGFTDESGAFMDRQEAAKHAWYNGQLSNEKSCPNTILSEDLW